MSLSQEEIEILDYIKVMLPSGLSGYPADYLSWVKMEYKKKGKPNISPLFYLNFTIHST